MRSQILIRAHQYRGYSIRTLHSTRSTPKIEMWNFKYKGPHSRNFSVVLGFQVCKYPFIADPNTAKKKVRHRVPPPEDGASEFLVEKVQTFPKEKCVPEWRSVESALIVHLNVLNSRTTPPELSACLNRTCTEFKVHKTGFYGT